MGWLGSIISGVKKVASAVTTAANPISAANWIGEKVIEPVLNKVGIKIPEPSPIAKKVTSVIEKSITGIQVIGTAIALGTTAAGAAAAKVILTNPVKSLAVAAAVPVISNVITKSPKTDDLLSKTITQAPSNLANFGANIGAFIENPSLQTAKDIIKENPIISGVTAAAGLIGAGGLVTTGVNALNTLEVRKNTAATIANTTTPEQPSVITIQQLPPALTAASDNLPPVTPKKKAAKKKTKKKVKKKKAKKKTKKVKKKKSVKKKKKKTKKKVKKKK